jgi:ABC-type amino acid transport substrate-binding protein
MNNQRRDTNNTLIRLMWMQLVLLTLASAAIAEPNSENAGEPVVVAYQPHNFPGNLTGGNGKASGVIIDFWLSWAEQAGIDIDFRIIDQLNPLDALRRGHVDTTLALYDEPHTSDQFVFANTGLPVPFHIYYHYTIRGLRSVDDLRGFRIGVIQNSTAKEYLLTRLPNSTVLVYPTAEALLKAAEAGEIRVFVAPGPTMRYALENRDLHYNSSPSQTGRRGSFEKPKKFASNHQQGIASCFYKEATGC